MKNSEIRNDVEKGLDQVFSDLQSLRDGVTGDSEKIINEMLTAVRFLQGKCFDLSNQEDIYKS